MFTWKSFGSELRTEYWSYSLSRGTKPKSSNRFSFPISATHIALQAGVARIIAAELAKPKVAISRSQNILFLMGLVEDCINVWTNLCNLINKTSCNQRASLLSLRSLVLKLYIFFQTLYSYRVDPGLALIGL